MIIFYKKVFLFIAAIGVCIYLMNRQITPAKVKLEKQRVDSILENKYRIKSVCLGRSHAAALCYDELPIVGVNMAMGGRDLGSILHWLKIMVPRLPQLEEVFISISYSSLYYDNKAFGAGVADARVALYHSLPGFEYINGDHPDFLIGKFFSFIHPDHGYNLIKSLLKRIKLVDDDFNKELSKAEMEESARYQSYIHAADRVRARRNGSQTIEKNVQFIHEICAYLKGHNISCIFFTPPYHQLYTHYFPKKDIQEMQDYMNDLSDSLGVTYLDYSIVKEITHDNSNFYNADHLNLKGKKLFSRLIAEDFFKNRE